MDATGYTASRNSTSLMVEATIILILGVGSGCVPFGTNSGRTAKRNERVSFEELQKRRKGCESLFSERIRRSGVSNRSALVAANCLSILKGICVKETWTDAIKFWLQ